jgi:hypothetical protein
MSASAYPVFKIPTEIPQTRASTQQRHQPARASSRRGKRAGSLILGTVRQGQGGRAVIETAEGIVVYPPQPGRDRDRWRAVWHEGGQRRQCETSTEDMMAGRLARIALRLTSHAPRLEQPGSALIDFYLSQDRFPEDGKWSRKHLATQQSLCRRFARPVIGDLACQDITVEHMQAVVNAAPTAKEGKRVRRMVSALVSAGRSGGFLVSPLLKEVHWQPGDRPAGPPPRPVPAGETALFVDPGRSRPTRTCTGSARCCARSATGCMS